MTPENLNDKLLELEKHLAAASTTEKQRANPRLRRMLAELTKTPSHRAPMRREAAMEDDPFDNLPV